MTTDQMDLFGAFAAEPIAKAVAAPAPVIVPSTPGPALVDVVDGVVELREGVEYRALLLWQRAYDALLANSGVNQEFSPRHIGDVVILQELGLHGSRRGEYSLIAELVAVTDRCQGSVKSFIWHFDNIRPVRRRPGRCTWKTGVGGELGRVTFAAGGES